MPIVSPDKLASLQRHAGDIRNICILAHVDHGKTSLTDALIATNGIISPKMAGKIRYLDSRPDEQLRGITMESSAISLCFSMSKRSSPEQASATKDYLINLIDSPGHVDFSSEVSTASRLCDGAIVVVDAVEGVCSQTVTVLRQVWIEHLKPILVINKVDRLIWELKMSAGEAYTHLSRLVEEVNAVIGSFFQGERMEEDLQWREKMEERVAAALSREMKKGTADRGEASYSSAAGEPDSQSSTENGDMFQERDDESIYFAPENNNIIFSSAVDGWAFTIRQFASLYEKKLGIKRSVLEKFLWGDYFLDPRTKRVLSSKHLKGRPLKPMFVQLVLENVWAVYEATTGGSKDKGDTSVLEKILKSLAITIPPHIVRSRDSRALMTTVFSQWLPLSTAILVSVVEYLPSPPEAQAQRLPALIDTSPGADFVSPTVRESMVSFKTADDRPAVAFISKMVSIPAEELPENKKMNGGLLSPEEARDLARKKRAEIAKTKAMSKEQFDIAAGITNSFSKTSMDDSNEDTAEIPHEPVPEKLVGFARLYSGTLSVGDTVYVLGPKFSPAHPHAAPKPRAVEITALYLIMGRSLEPLAAVPAGVVFGIGGLEGHILKSGTICTQLEGGVNLAGLSMGGQPIVRVALEPINPQDLGKLISGMRLLEQSDPCAQYEVLESGEHVISTAGELHLERCLKDLRERFARCEIQAGEPIVPFRESVVSTAEMSPPKSKDLPRGTVISVSSSQQLTIQLRVVPLPEPLAEFLDQRSGSIRQLYSDQQSIEHALSGKVKHTRESTGIGDVAHDPSFQAGKISLASMKDDMRALVQDIGIDQEFWSTAVDRTAAFGPRRTGANLLIDSTGHEVLERLFGNTRKADVKQPNMGTLALTDTPKPSDFADRVMYAFQLALAQGPLCNEPMSGIGVFLEEISWPLGSPQADDIQSRTDLGRLTGDVIRTTREAIHQGFLDWSPRMMLAMYSCEIQASAEVLGRVYAVITRRRGRILSEALNEGTPFFTITSVIPVAESFGFSEEIRKRTSGGASPQLRFQGFERLDQDPFWVPSTGDELEDLGELADRENVAKKYMDALSSTSHVSVSSFDKIDIHRQIATAPLPSLPRLPPEPPTGPLNQQSTSSSFRSRFPATISSYDLTSFITDSQQPWLTQSPSARLQTQSPSQHDFDRNQDFVLYDSSADLSPTRKPAELARATYSTAFNHSANHTYPSVSLYKNLRVRNSIQGLSGSSSSSPCFSRSGQPAHSSYSNSAPHSTTGPETCPRPPVPPFPQSWKGHVPSPAIMPQSSSRNDLTSDLFDFAPEQFFDNDPLSSEYRLFEQSEGTTSFAMSHLGGIAGSMTVLPGSNGTVSPQDIWTEPLSAPPSAALTNLSTPGTTFESPYAVHSAETSPLMHADPVEDNNEWTSLFPGEHSPIEEDIEPSVERATALMSRATSSSGQNASTTLRHSSVVGIKSRRRDKPLPPIVRDPHDAPDIAKRKRNTEAARKSRAKRQNAMEALQSQVEDLQYQVYHWRTVAETGHAPLEPFDFSKADQVP